MKKLFLFAAAFIAISMSFASCSGTTENSGKCDTTVVSDSDTVAVDSAVVVDSVK